MGTGSKNHDGARLTHGAFLREGFHERLLGGKAHRRSLGYARTASRGRRDDKGEGWLLARRSLSIGWGNPNQQHPTPLLIRLTNYGVSNHPRLLSFRALPRDLRCAFAPNGLPGRLPRPRPLRASLASIAKTRIDAGVQLDQPAEEPHQIREAVQIRQYLRLD